MKDLIEKMKHHFGLGLLAVVMCVGTVLAMGTASIKGQADGYEIVGGGEHHYDMSGDHYDQVHQIEDISDQQGDSGAENSNTDPCTATPLDINGTDHYLGIIKGIAFNVDDTYTCEVAFTKVVFAKDAKKKCGDKTLFVKHKANDSRPLEICRAMVDFHIASNSMYAMTNQEAVANFSTDGGEFVDLLKTFHSASIFWK